MYATEISLQMTWAPASLGLSGLLTGWIPRQLLFLVGNAMNSILILFIHRYQSNFSPSMLILAYWQEMRAELLNGTMQWNAYHIAIFWGDRSPQTTETKANINRWDYIKLKNFAQWSNLSTQQKDNLPNGRKYMTRCDQ